MQVQGPSNLNRSLFVCLFLTFTGFLTFASINYDGIHCITRFVEGEVENIQSSLKYFTFRRVTRSRGEKKRKAIESNSNRIDNMF